MRPFWVAIIGATISSCSASLTMPGDGLSGNCAIEHRSLVQGGAHEILLSNHCKQCLVVTFDYHRENTPDDMKSGCYVPAETRVIFQPASTYKVTGQMYCDDLAQQHSTAAARLRQLLMDNYRNDQCKIFGVFAD